MSAPIYLDYNATTPVDEDVLSTMLPFFSERFGNPASEHALGWSADEAVKQARERTARLIGANARTITFTSGATESISLALRGAGGVYGGRRHHVVTIKTEHKAVLETCAAMERDGFEVTYLPVDRSGQPDLDQLRDAVTDKTLLVCAMWANNETGVVLPIPEIAAIAHEEGALMMTDATQAVGKLPIHVDRAGVDLLTLSSHKMYGPKGVGALFVRRRGPRVRLQQQINGGQQEDGMRAGTLNVPGIVGLGAAALLARGVQADDAERMSALRDQFEKRLLEEVPSAKINGVESERLPNTTSVRFQGVRSGQLLPALRGVAASVGAACQTGGSNPSHVLTAMGLRENEAFSTLRFSLGRPTTSEQIESAVLHVADAVRNVRHRLAA
jgi:cysteine desulfurase